jgi:hypothetical protein
MNSGYGLSTSGPQSRGLNTTLTLLCSQRLVLLQDVQLPAGDLAESW